jgi:chitinase
LCCSQWGYCGTGPSYCGTTSGATVAPTAGPATKSPTAAPSKSPTAAPSKAPTTAPGTCSLSQIFSQAQWDTLFPHANYAGNNAASNPNYAGQASPFTYSNFITAAASYRDFACTGDLATRQRELAAFLAQTSHETTGGTRGASDQFFWGYCFSRELTCSTYCGGDTTTYPCTAGKSYCGRGPIQLSWNYNYGQASAAIFGNKNTLLTDPDQVSTNGVTAFKTALWFWMTAQGAKPSCHDVMTGAYVSSGNRVAGFGLTTNIINGGIECGYATPDAVTDRVGFFSRYTSFFGVSTGNNLYCDAMTPYA